MSPANSPLIDVSDDQLETLIERIERFVNSLKLNQELVIHQYVDQFYYMEKVAELRVLTDRLKDLQSTIHLLQCKKAEHYFTLIDRLTADEAWMNSPKPLS